MKLKSGPQGGKKKVENHCFTAPVGEALTFNVVFFSYV
jgi:hypothetical protein